MQKMQLLHRCSSDVQGQDGPGKRRLLLREGKLAFVRHVMHTTSISLWCSVSTTGTPFRRPASTSRGARTFREARMGARRKSARANCARPSGKKKASTWSAPSGFVRAAADTSRPFCRALSRADTRTTARESSILNPPVAVSHASSHRKTSTPTNGMLSSYR